MVAGSHAKLITVVVPFRNEAKTLPNTLEQLRRDTGQVNCEVLLVDSSSTDESAQLIDSFTVEHRLEHFRRITTTAKNPGDARNHGVELAQGEYVAFLDCGLDVTPQWLLLQLNQLRHSPHKSWISGFVTCEGEGLIDQCAIANTYGIGRSRPALPGSLVPRHMFLEVGRFPALRAGEDGEWIFQAAQAGWNRILNSHVTVRYQGTAYSENLMKLFVKSFRYSVPGIQLQIKTRYLLHSGLVGAFLIVGFSDFDSKLLILIYFALRIFVAAGKCRRRLIPLLTPVKLPVLILTFCVIDIGRQIGFWVGVIQFGFRKITRTETSS